MGISDYLASILRNLYAGQEPIVRIADGTTDWFKIGKGVQGCTLSLYIFNSSVECTHAKSLQSCLTLFNPMVCSPRGSCVHGILQAETLKGAAVSCSRGSSDPGIEPPAVAFPALAGRFFTNCATWKTPTKDYPAPNVTKSKLAPLATWQANKLRDELLGQGIQVIWKASRLRRWCCPLLVSHRTLFPKWAFRLLLY